MMTLGGNFKAEAEVEVETASMAEDATVRGGARKIWWCGGRGKGA